MANGGEVCLHRDESALNGQPNGVSTVLRAELAADRREMKFDGLVADAEMLGNGLVRQAFGQQLQHVHFTRGQRLQGRRVALERRRGLADRVYRDESLGAMTGC